MRVLTSLGVGFFLTPVIIHEIGTNDYGLWMLVLAVISYFQLADLGFTRALMHETAINRTNGAEQLTRENVSSFAVLFTLLAILLLALTAILSFVFPVAFGIAEEDRWTARIVFLLIGSSWALQLPTTTAVGVLQGYERFDILSGLMSSTRVLSGVTSIVVLLLGGGLVGLALTVVAFDLVTSVGRIYFVRRELKGVGFSLRDVRLGHLRASLGRSTAYFLGTTRGIVAFRLDALIIGAFMTVASVGVYGVAMRLVQLARTLAIPLNEVLMPATSRLANQPGANAELSRVMANTTRIGTGIMAGITTLFIVFGVSFLDLWIGPEVEDAYTPLVILSVAMVIQLAHDMPARVLLVSELHRYNSFLNIANIAINVGLSVILVQSFGLTGVALGTLVSVGVVGAITVVLSCRHVSTSQTQFILTAILPALAPALPAGALGYGLRLLVKPDSWIALAAEAGAAAAVFGLTFLLLNPPLRAAISKMVAATRRTRGSKTSLRQAVEGVD